LEKAIIGDQKDFLVLVSHHEGQPVGVLAAYAFTPVFTNQRIACEVFWYLEPQFRKGNRGTDMMRAYEYWAKLVGCVVAQYGWLVSSPEKMPILYERTGAGLAEQVYYKVL
jgi:GNAT superfamily N-acetyltransferase